MLVKVHHWQGRKLAVWDNSYYMQWCAGDGSNRLRKANCYFLFPSLHDVTSQWRLDIGCDGSTDTMKKSKHYKIRVHQPQEPIIKHLLVHH